jgi:hypothetical protein
LGTLFFIQRHKPKILLAGLLTISHKFFNAQGADDFHPGRITGISIESRYYQVRNSEIMNTPPVWVLISQAAQAVRGRYSSAPGASMPEK